MTTKITKRIELAPGGIYEFSVKAPQQLTIHAFDANITLEPGDELHLVITAPPHPKPSGDSSAGALAKAEAA